jgi:hypothetical protein
MAVKYTTTELVASIKRRGNLPNAQQLFTDDALITLASEEMLINIVPLLMNVREEFFVTYSDFSVSKTDIGFVELDIPYDAIGAKVREVCYVHNNSLIPIPQWGLDQTISNSRMDYQKSNGYSIRGNKIIINTGYMPDSTGTVRVYYFSRPLELISQSQSGKITSINTITNELTLSFLPNTWVVGDTVNIVGSAQPFETKVKSVAITASSFPLLTVASLTGISVGDYVSLEGYSPIIQLPVEAQKVLAQATVVKCLESLNDAQGLQAAEAKLRQNKEDLINMISIRVEGASQKIVSSGGILGNSRAMTGRRFF